MTPSGEHAEAPGREDVADLVQETFARAFGERARLGFDGIREFGPYLGTIARNLLVDWARRRGREVPSELAPDVLASPARDESSDEAWAEPGTMQKVEAYLKSLPPELAAVHRERHVLSRSQRYAAEVTRDSSRQQLRTREQRLRDGLRRWLRR